jgi:hypothetical protein
MHQRLLASCIAFCGGQHRSAAAAPCDSREVSMADVPPGPTLYVNNLYEKLPKEGGGKGEVHAQGHRSISCAAHDLDEVHPSAA